MKKVSCITAVLALVGSTAFGQIQFAPEIGGNMFKQTQKVENGGVSSSINGKFLPGLRAGAVVDIPVAEHFSVRPGLFYNLNRTRRFEVDIMGIEATVTQTTHNLELPVYFTFKATGHETGGFFAGIGPYLSYALGGSLNTEASIGPISTETSMEFGNDADEDHMKPLDVGGSVMLGYELPIGLYFKGHYNLGLMNQQPGGNSDNTRKAMSFGLSVGYFMGR